MPVWEVEVLPGKLDVITEGIVHNVTFNFTAKISENLATVRGQNLWKVSAWVSASFDGEGKRISYTEQVSGSHLEPIIRGS